jgi:hypothetical protein
MGSSPSDSPPYRLDPAVSPQAVADACRYAGLAFLDGAVLGFGPRGLADWLDGPYRTAVGFRRLCGVDRSPTQPVAGLACALVRLVRSSVIDNLRELSTGDWACVVESIRVGAIVHARTREGDLVWLPADEPGLRLDHRVRSMFVCDYLWSAEPYERDLRICAERHHIRFDGDDECGRCSGSGVRLRTATSMTIARQDAKTGRSTG